MAIDRWHVGDERASEWFAVHVWTGREQSCARHLSARGYEVFLPCYLEQRRWSDRVKRVNRALFAGYVFCHIASMTIAKIVTAPGVIRVVGDANGPLPVCSDEIEAIRRIVHARFNAEPYQFPRVGDRVRLESGPLRGLEGIVQPIHNRHRLVVAVSLLQRAVAVEIDPGWVTSVAG